VSDATFYFTAEDGSDPVVFTKEGHMKKYLGKVVAAFVWAQSPTGRKDLGAFIAAATAIYTALHRAGV